MQADVYILSWQTYDGLLSKVPGYDEGGIRMTFLGYEIYNDMQLIPLYIIGAFAGLLLLATSMVAHEFGHILGFRIFAKKKIRIRFAKFKLLAGDPGDYDGLTDKQYMQINSTGIIMGAIPLIVVGFVFAPLILMLVPYCWGCRKDIKNVLERMNIDEDL